MYYVSVKCLIFTLIIMVQSIETEKWLHLAKGTEKFILGRYLLLGILLILPSLRPWGIAARPVILENRGGKSHFCDYFIIRARYVYLSYYKKCRACNSLHFLLFMLFCQINSFVVTACRNREFLLFLYFLFFSHHHRGRGRGGSLRSAANLPAAANKTSFFYFAPLTQSV
jgi:hypothetical protein